MSEELPHLAGHTVEVDRELCLTAAICLAYGIYELDDEGKAVILTSNGSNSDEPGNPLQQDGRVLLSDLIDSGAMTEEELKERVYASAQACPFNAIIVRDANGTPIWPPPLEA